MKNPIATSKEPLIRRRRLCAAMAGLLAPLPTFAQAGNWQVLMNRWKQDQYLNIQGGAVAASQINFTWWSAHWNFQAAMQGAFTRQKRGYFIQNRWKEDHFLYVDGGGLLKAGPIEPGAEAAFWALESAGDNFVRINSHHLADAYLQIDAFGYATVGPSPSGYWSGHWRRYTPPG